jgi:predicted nucleotidyltransferase
MLELETIKEVLSRDERVIFAYLFGSAKKGKKFNDIDIGIYSKADGLLMEVFS